MTTKLIFKEETAYFDHDDDIDVMVRVLKKNDCSASRADLRKAWEAYSESYAAGWMTLPNDDDDIYQILMRNLEEE
jgi:hypothetical protein